MEKRINLFDGDYVGIYHETEENKQVVWDMLIDWCAEHFVYNSECFQNDNPVIEAPNLIAQMVDKVLKFDVKEIMK